ncbi:hypothetical protein [Niallia sp.]|uniref:hypothetical protein n=1 Tax=Niallia sp. TaxID=2837523 RepID=UPI00289FD053|nr:hypothetical protein [Niallia sp.]
MKKREEELQKAKTFTNKYGVVIEKEDCIRLMGLGYDFQDIENLTQEEYNLNNGITGEDMGIQTTYIKTTYIYKENSSQTNENVAFSTTSNESDITVIEQKDEILTEKEFYEELEQENESTFSTLSDSDLLKETTYKIMDATLTKLSTGKYRITTSLRWKKMPINRLEDVIAAAPRRPDYFTLSRSSRQGKQYYEASGRYYAGDGVYKTSNVSDTIEYGASSSKWKDEFDGMALVSNLKDNYIGKVNGENVSYKVNYIKIKMWYDFSFAKSYGYDYVEVKSAYKHRTSDGGLNLDSIEITYGAPVINLGANGNAKYDGEITLIPSIKK